jgi:phage shock protein PspC (stress-responsive transcriptional regulator)
MATEPEPVADIAPSEPASPRKLYRSNTQRVVAGVCGGLGEYTGVDPVWYRIGFVLLTIGGGSGVLIYLLMWLIVQPAPQGYTPSAPGQSQGSVTGLAILGIVLVIVGPSRWSTPSPRRWDSTYGRSPSLWAGWPWSWEV